LSNQQLPAPHQAGAGQILSICFRSYAQGKGTQTVSSTAAATIRQAVAILFDHAVVPGGQTGTHTFQPQPLTPPQMGSHAHAGSMQHHAAHAHAVHAHHSRLGRTSEASSAGGGSNVSTPRAPQPHLVALQATTGRERAALLLLLDLTDMCGGAAPSWLKCPVVGRAFVLDLLEFVLMHRPQAFHSIDLFGEALRDKVRAGVWMLARCVFFWGGGAGLQCYRGVELAAAACATSSSPRLPPPSSHPPANPIRCAPSCSPSARRPLIRTRSSLQHPSAAPRCGARGRCCGGTCSWCRMPRPRCWSACWLGADPTGEALAGPGVWASQVEAAVVCCRQAHTLCCTKHPFFICVSTWPLPTHTKMHTPTHRPVWQRIQALTVLRGLAADAPLTYCLFRTYDMSIHRDVNAVHDTVRTAVDILKVRGWADGWMDGLDGWMGGRVGDCCTVRAHTNPAATPNHPKPPLNQQAFARASHERPEDDLLNTLGALHSARAAGKELQAPDGLDFPTGPAGALSGGGGAGGGPGAYGEVWVAHGALELLLGVVSTIESLADGVLRAAAERGEGGGVGEEGEVEPPDMPGGWGGGSVSKGFVDGAGGEWLVWNCSCNSLLPVPPFK